MAGRSGWWCRTFISGRARSGFAASSSRPTIIPDTGRCAAITTAATPVRNSATPTIPEFRVTEAILVGDARPQVWIASGVRTPFAKVDGPLAELDAIAL